MGLRVRVMSLGITLICEMRACARAQSIVKARQSEQGNEVPEAAFLC